MHLVSFVDSFHRVHLVPGMRSRRPRSLELAQCRRRSSNFFKSRSRSLEPIRCFWIFYVFVAVPYNFCEILFV